jgi:hypothetical protein
VRITKLNKLPIRVRQVGLSRHFCNHACLIFKQGKKNKYNFKSIMETTATKTTFDYQSLDQKGKTIVEYVWLGGTGQDLRCKAKTFDRPINSVEDLEGLRNPLETCGPVQ